MNISNEIITKGYNVRTKAGLNIGQVIDNNIIKTRLNITMPECGIRYNAAKTDAVVMTCIDTATGAMNSSPYVDNFDSNLPIFTMSGEGLEDDQYNTHGNKVLANQKLNSTDVHLVQKIGKNQFVYCGLFEVIKVFSDIPEKDKNGNIRKVFKFILTPA